MHARVDVGHEGVEMDAAFERQRRDLEEDVHQQGFAAPHRAVNIEAARRAVRLGADQAAEGAGAPARPIADEPRSEAVQARRQFGLRRIGLQAAVGDERPVAPENGSAHCDDVSQRGAIAAARTSGLRQDGAPDAVAELEASTIEQHSAAARAPHERNCA